MSRQRFTRAAGNVATPRVVVRLATLPRAFSAAFFCRSRIDNAAETIKSERVRGGAADGRSVMEKLTTADVQELSWWFAVAAPVYVAGGLAAQSYEPRTGSGYDPATDMRLVNMVAAASRRSSSEWSRVERILDGLGAVTVDVLRRAFGPRPANALLGYTFPEVALITRPVLERARVVAEHDELVRLLEVAQLDAMRDRCSPMAIAIRVVESERVARVVVTHDMVAATARRLLERALKQDVELLVAVKLEMQRLVDEAGDAYRRARAELGAARRSDKAARRKAAAAALDEALGKKRRKESDRFEAKLRRAS